ncbi:ornithine cyclodeaminase family protein [Nocardia sp. NBC_01327]|uniref:ornithine cyclodeaminase family protein n=1 Tax=Nocardia sp. NBC_01327 TaxID=2903593 RepID=UPI002E13152C|nr:ornithine cyclodeaminase family protein [Nocardia sp. NBC_01327]
MTLILTRSDIAGLLDRRAVRHAVEAAHAALATGHVQNPAPQAITLPHNGSAIPMTAADEHGVTVKLLADLPANRARGLPTQRSTIIVTSAVTGECVAVLDGRAITAVRTAAASAVATDYLARQDASVLGLVGAGNLAIEHAHAIADVRRIRKIVLWSRTTDTVATFRAGTESLGITTEFAESPESVVERSDIVCTLTPSRDPIVSGHWFRPGQHINAIGAPPRPDHREIDAAGMRRARLVVDHHPTVMAKSGAVLQAIAEHAITADDARTELGHVINNRALGRHDDTCITLFESVGLGLQDLATTQLVLTEAIEHNIGHAIDLTN